MTESRELVLKAMSGQETERVPFGMWHHFVLGKDQFRGLEDQSILERAYQGHLEYYEKIKPDIMKIMSEGFFGYPPIMDNPLETEEDLLSIKSIGKDHPWIKEQVKHVKRISNLFKDEVFTFYNIFAPLQIIRIRFDFYDLEFDRFVDLCEKYPSAMLKAGLEIQKDIKELVQQLFDNDAVDGIYYCVQNVQSKMFDKDMYDKYIRPTEIEVLKLANSLRNQNILHICGYARHTNDFNFYQDYKARIYNWAVHTEKISLSEGKKYFDDACVLGGFDNNPGSLIDLGSQQELEDYVKQLIEENGHEGFILGADCSVPNDIDDKQIRIIRDACHKFKGA